MDSTAITGIVMVSVYAVDYEESFRFYNGVLGLGNWSPMGDHACYFSLPDGRGMYLVGRRNPVDADHLSVRTTFAFEVASAFEMYAKLKATGVELVPSEPMDMGQGYYWFQFFDPSRNIVEILGGR